MLNDLSAIFSQKTEELILMNFRKEVVCIMRTVIGYFYPESSTNSINVSLLALNLYL